MATDFNSMQLLLWDEGDDPYSHAQLVNNWLKVAEHDHTSGKGVKVPGGGIADNAISANHISNGALPGGKLQDGSVDVSKLSADLLAAIIPLGVVFPWTRLHSSQSIPAGVGTLFEIPHGQVVNDHDIPGVVGSITLPDYTDKFLFYVYGSDGSVTGIYGGDNFKNLSHSHTVAPHTHPTVPHSHTVNSHSHSVSDHAHSIALVGDHAHTIAGDPGHRHNYTDSFGANQHMASRNVGIGSGERQALYIPNFNQDGTSATAPMNIGGAHNHGGATGAAGAHNHGGATGGVTGPVSTTSASPGTSSSAPNTLAPTSTVSTNGALSSSFDFRPSFVTVIPLMRVRNP